MVWNLVQIWILFGILKIPQQNVVVWREAAFSHWPSGPLLFPPLTPYSTSTPHVHARGPPVYTSQFCPQPPANSHPLATHWV